MLSPVHQPCPSSQSTPRLIRFPIHLTPLLCAFHCYLAAICCCSCSVLCGHTPTLFQVVVPVFLTLCLNVTHLVSSFLPALPIRLDLICVLTTNDSTRKASFFLHWKCVFGVCTCPVGIRDLYCSSNQPVGFCP